jgi:hypothetical protein
VRYFPRRKSVQAIILNLLDENWDSLIARESGWSSGWPMWFAYRSVGPPADAEKYTVAKAWFDGRNVASFRWYALVVDFVIASVITLSTIFVLEKWSRRVQVRPQFSLKFLLAVTATVAFYAAFDSAFFRNHWTVIALSLAKLCVYSAITLTCLVAMDVFEWFWRRLRPA